MSTKERIRLGNVCGHISRESEDTGTGLWGHFAGRIQPGFNNRITMECRSNVNRIVSAGDYAALVNFDKMDRPLGEKEGYVGAYVNQTLAPKMFKKLLTD